MDLSFSAAELDFRDEVRGWLRANLPADLREKVVGYQDLSRDDLLRWHRILAKKGWIAPAWPQEWGGTGWNLAQRFLFDVHDDFVDHRTKEAFLQIKRRCIMVPQSR